MAKIWLRLSKTTSVPITLWIRKETSRDFMRDIRYASRRTIDDDDDDKEEEEAKAGWRKVKELPRGPSSGRRCWEEEFAAAKQERTRMKWCFRR